MVQDAVITTVKRKKRDKRDECILLLKGYYTLIFDHLVSNWKKFRFFWNKFWSRFQSSV